MTAKDCVIVAVDDHADPLDTSGPSMTEKLAVPTPNEGGKDHTSPSPIAQDHTSPSPIAQDHSIVEVEPASGSTVRTSLDHEEDCADPSRGSSSQVVGEFVSILVGVHRTPCLTIHFHSIAQSIPIIMHEKCTCSI
jgi:hypothetical protein